MRDDFFKLAVSILLLLVILFSIYSVFRPPVTLLEPFEVPQDLSTQGVTGVVIANKVLDQINAISSKSKTADFPRGFTEPGSVIEKFLRGKAPSEIKGPREEIQVSVQGISLGTLITHIGAELGRHVRIAGEIYRTGDRLNATARITNKPGRVITFSSTDLTELCRNIALQVLRITEPVTLLQFYLHTHNQDGALDLIGEILRVSTSKEEQSNAYNSWGLLLQDHGRYEEAIAKYRWATEINPRASGAYVNWGNALHNWGRSSKDPQKHTEAVAKFEKAIEIKPYEAAAYSNWGFLLQSLNKYKEAEEKYRIAGNIDPRFRSLADASLGLVLQQQGEIDKAIEVYKSAIRLRPGFTPAYLNLSQLLGARGREREGYALLEEASVIDPKAFEIYWAWGAMLADIGKDYPQSVAKFERAAQLNPNFDELELGWGRGLYNMGGYEIAISHFRRAAELDNHKAEPYYLLGLSFNALGRTNDAKASFGRYLQMEPHGVHSKDVQRHLESMK